MPKFRKKPLVIEARQWPYTSGDLVEDHDAWPEVGSDANGYFVITIHGQAAYLAKGDWILPEPDGVHFYPCKPDIFAQTYELVLTGEESAQGGAMTVDDLVARGIDREAAEFVCGEQWSEAQISALADAALRGNGAIKTSYVEPAEMFCSPPDPGPAIGDLMKEDTDATPTCEYCGAIVHDPCSATGRDITQRRCELPPGTVYVDDRRKNRIGAPGVEVSLDDPRHPTNRDIQFFDALKGAINSHSRENGSETPDFILATFLFACLTGFDIAVSRRSQWYDYPGRIAALEARLEAEGEHTAAGNAEIARLNNEIERITRRQQGVLAEATQKLHKAQNPTGWGK